MPEQDVIDRATSMGWKPKEEFRGNPDNWREPEVFIQMAENSLPIAKGTIAQMESTINEQRAMIADLKADMTGLVEHFKGAEERAYNQAMKDLQKKQQEAKEAGDMSAFVEATEAIQDKIAQHPAVTGKADTTVQPASPQAALQTWLNAEPGVYEKWVAENDWYTKDMKLFDAAERADRFLSARDGLTKPRSYRLAEIARIVKEEHPDKFGNPRRKAGSPVEPDTGGGPADNGKGRSFHDLPPESQKQAVKWCGKDGKGESGSIKGMTFDQYLKSYKW